MSLGRELGAGRNAAAALAAPDVLGEASKPAAAEPALSLGARVLLWDYDRGSLAYDVLCAFLVLLLLLVPAAWWGDPMLPRL